MRIQEIDTFVVPRSLEERELRPGFRLGQTDPHPLSLLRPDHPGDPAAGYLPYWRSRASDARALEVVIVRLETDTGVVGWGEAHTPVPSALGQVIEVLTPIVYGADPLDVDPIWESMHAALRLPGHGGGILAAAMSAIDIAVWDAAGKVLGCPVAKLLGGRMRDRVPVYACGLPRVSGTAGEASGRELTEPAARLIDEGHRAIEVGLGLEPERAREHLHALRAAVGSGVGLIVDAGGAYDLALARRVGRILEEEGVLWIAEPLLHADVRGYTQLADALTIAVGGGQGLASRWAFNEFIAAGALALVQPSVACTGGISEAKRISDLADAYGVPFAPRLGTGTVISRAATLQWAAAGANLRLCAWPVGPDPLQEDLLSEPFRLEDGAIRVPVGPGLGIELDEDTLLRATVEAGRP